MLLQRLLETSQGLVLAEELDDVTDARSSLRECTISSVGSEEMKDARNSWCEP